MRKHPIIAISLAAFAGFAGTLVAVPSKGERELRHLERLRRATNPSPEKSSESEAVKTAVDGAYQAAKPAIWVMLLKEIVAFAKPILLAQITNKIRQQSQQPVPPPPTQPSF